MPRKVLGAIYADGLVLWYSEEHLTTANYRLQHALNILEGWTKRWLVKINHRKTTYTIFSLSTKEQRANLHINGQTVLAGDKPTYVGVTFDKRLTGQQQTEKAEVRANVRLALTKKLARTTWGADTVTLKSLYSGRSVGRSKRSWRDNIIGQQGAVWTSIAKGQRKLEDFGRGLLPAAEEHSLE